jgi:hypothetical protein
MSSRHRADKSRHADRNEQRLRIRQRQLRTLGRSGRSHSRHQQAAGEARRAGVIPSRLWTTRRFQSPPAFSRASSFRGMTSVPPELVARSSGARSPSSPARTRCPPRTRGTATWVIWWATSWRAGQRATRASSGRQAGLLAAERGTGGRRRIVHDTLAALGTDEARGTLPSCSMVSCGLA